MAERKWAEDEREKVIVRLQQALADVKRLSGFLPICVSCKKIRDDKGYCNKLRHTFVSIRRQSSATGFALNVRENFIPSYSHDRTSFIRKFAL